MLLSGHKAVVVQLYSVIVMLLLVLTIGNRLTLPECIEGVMFYGLRSHDVKRWYALS